MTSKQIQRAVLLPLDCSVPHLAQLFNKVGQGVPPLDDRLEEYCVEALRLSVGPDDQPCLVEFHEIATFAIRAAVRVEHADPVTGTRHYEGFPVGSSERRMMEQPLRKHPGLSRLTQHIQKQYVHNVLYAFKNAISDSMRREIVATLLAPDSEHESSTPTQPARTYTTENESIDALHARYADRVTQYDNGFGIPFERVTARTFIEPLNDQLYLPDLEQDNLPPLERRGDVLFVPTDVVLVRLANYAHHAWYRLVHIAYSVIPDSNIPALIEMTPKADNRILDELKFRRPRTSFTPHYGTDTDNPLLDPDFADRISRPDKRIITVADAIRGSATHSFDEHILLPNLFQEICEFFPAPSRPSNDIADKETLKDAFDAVIDNWFDVGERVFAYSTPAPKLTPFFPYTAFTPWNQYRHELALLPKQPVTISKTPRISPGMPEPLWPTTSTEYASARQHAEQVTVTEPRYDASRVHDVQPLIDPAELTELSADEILFLTRVGLAMERRIKSYSLTDSMAAFKTNSDGNRLNIDIPKLEDQDYLTRPKSPQTYYSVPWNVRDTLDIPNVSHDGWGERLPTENTLHRAGVDLFAFHIAARPDVDRVVRYCDLWRLQPTTCWDAVSHLDGKRLDVIGFAQGDPVVAGEIETETGDTDGALGTIAKLDAFPQSVDRYFITPSGEHLSTILSRLTEHNQFPDTVSEREEGGCRPVEVQTTLDNCGAISDIFDDLLTYHHIQEKLPDQFETARYEDCIIGAI